MFLKKKSCVLLLLIFGIVIFSTIVLAIEPFSYVDGNTLVKGYVDASGREHITSRTNLDSSVDLSASLDASNSEKQAKYDSYVKTSDEKIVKSNGDISSNDNYVGTYVDGVGTVYSMVSLDDGYDNSCSFGSSEVLSSNGKIERRCNIQNSGEIESDSGYIGNILYTCDDGNIFDPETGRCQFSKENCEESSIQYVSQDGKTFGCFPKSFQALFESIKEDSAENYVFKESKYVNGMTFGYFVDEEILCKTSPTECYCSKNSDCTSGYVCDKTTGKCAVSNSCLSDSGCISGYDCISGKCVATFCSSNSDCTEDGYICNGTSGQCIFSYVKYCNENPDSCGMSWDSFCRKNPTKCYCSENSDCTSGYVCDKTTGKCAATFCSSNSDCTEDGYICNGTSGQCIFSYVKYCRENPTKCSCSENSDCISGYACDTATGKCILDENDEKKWSFKIVDISSYKGDTCYSRICNNVSGFSEMEGIGSEEEPYMITDCVQLYNVGSNTKYNSSANYALGNDIDCSSVKFFSLPSFSGSLDGLNHMIKNLDIYQNSGNDVGLFSEINGGTVKNLQVYAGVIVGNSSVGGIAGKLKNEGKIVNCSFSGDVESRTYYATRQVILNCPTMINISTCDFSGGDSEEVTCISEGRSETCGANINYQSGGFVQLGKNIGGLVGTMESGLIERSFVQKDSSVMRDLPVSFYSKNVGGIVGLMNGGTILNTYTRANIGTSYSIGMNNTGGFVGLMNGGSIYFTYAAPDKMFGGSNVGGFVGSMTGGYISASFSSSYGGVVASGSAGGFAGSKIGGNIQGVYFNTFSQSSCASNSAENSCLGTSYSNFIDENSVMKNFKNVGSPISLSGTDSIWYFSGEYPILRMGWNNDTQTEYCYNIGKMCGTLPNGIKCGDCFANFECNNGMCVTNHILDTNFKAMYVIGSKDYEYDYVGTTGTGDYGAFFSAYNNKLTNCKDDGYGNFSDCMFSASFNSHSMDAYFNLTTYNTETMFQLSDYNEYGSDSGRFSFVVMWYRFNVSVLEENLTDGTYAVFLGKFRDAAASLGSSNSTIKNRQRYVYFLKTDGNISSFDSSNFLKKEYNDQMAITLTNDELKSVVKGGIVNILILTDGNYSEIETSDDDDDNSCAFVYSYNGEEYNPEFSIAGSSAHKLWEDESYGLLSSLTKVDGKYTVGIWEQVQETQYIDDLELLKIVHSDDVWVVPEYSGDIHTFNEKIYPSSVEDSVGNSYLDEVSSGSDNYWVSDYNIINTTMDNLTVKFDLSDYSDFKYNIAFSIKDTGRQYNIWHDIVTAAEGYNVLNYSVLNKDLDLFYKITDWILEYVSVYVYQKQKDGSLKLIDSFIPGNGEFFHTYSLDFDRVSDVEELVFVAPSGVYQIADVYASSGEDDSYSVVRLKSNITSNSMNVSNDKLNGQLKNRDWNYLTLEYDDYVMVDFEDDSELENGEAESLILYTTAYSESYSKVNNEYEIGEGKDSEILNKMFFSDDFMKNYVREKYGDFEISSRGVFAVNSIGLKEHNTFYEDKVELILLSNDYYFITKKIEDSSGSTSTYLYDYAACGYSNSCVYDSRCYENGNSTKITATNYMACVNGVWKDMDNDKQYCGFGTVANVEGNFVFWNMGGNSASGSTKCCGDDVNEYTKYNLFGDSWYYACCNSSNSCVKNGNNGQKKCYGDQEISEDDLYVCNCSVSGGCSWNFVGGSDEMIGAGTQSSPYIIYNCEQIKGIINRNNGVSTVASNKGYTLDKYYVLNNSINCGGAELRTIGVDEKFSGDFNGNGYEISNFSINGTANGEHKGTGLFYGINSNGVVRNLRLSNFNVTGYTNKGKSGNNLSGESLTGGIAGINEGMIVNCTINNVNIFSKIEFYSYVECLNNSDCDEDQYCYNNFCYDNDNSDETTDTDDSSCSENSDCRAGYFCNTTTNKCAATFCSSNSDCKEDGYICNLTSGQCLFSYVKYCNENPDSCGMTDETTDTNEGSGGGGGSSGGGGGSSVPTLINLVIAPLLSSVLNANNFVSAIVENSSYSDGGYGLGGIAGSNTGTISSCSVSGANIGTNAVQYYRVLGGITGYNTGNITNSYIENSYIGDSEISINGPDYVGGLVGLLSPSGILKNSYVNNVQIKGSTYVGGLVGNTKGNVWNCFENKVELSVLGLNYKNSIEGCIFGDNSVDVKNIYYNGENCGNEQYNTFWSITLSPISAIWNGVGSNGNVGILNTVSLYSTHKGNLFSSWDFNNIWSNSTALPTLKLIVNGTVTDRENLLRECKAKNYECGYAGDVGINCGSCDDSYVCDIVAHRCISGNCLWWGGCIPGSAGINAFFSRPSNEYISNPDVVFDARISTSFLNNVSFSLNHVSTLLDVIPIRTQLQNGIYNLNGLKLAMDFENTPVGTIGLNNWVDNSYLGYSGLVMSGSVNGVDGSYAVFSSTSSSYIDSKITEISYQNFSFGGWVYVNRQIEMHQRTSLGCANSYGCDSAVYGTPLYERCFSGCAGTSGQNYLFTPTHGGACSDKSGAAGAGLSVGINGVQVFEHCASYMPPVVSYPISLSGWNHIMVVYNNGIPTLYINGINVSNSTNSITTERSVKNVFAPTVVGSSLSMYSNFSGSVDAIRIFNRSLTAKEVKTVYEYNLKQNNGHSWTFVNVLGFSLNYLTNQKTYYEYTLDSVNSVSKNSTTNKLYVLEDISPKASVTVLDSTESSVRLNVSNTGFPTLLNFSFSFDNGDLNLSMSEPNTSDCNSNANCQIYYNEESDIKGVMGIKSGGWGILTLNFAPKSISVAEDGTTTTRYDFATSMTKEDNSITLTYDGLSLGLLMNELDSPVWRDNVNLEYDLSCRDGQFYVISGKKYSCVCGGFCESGKICPCIISPTGSYILKDSRVEVNFNASGSKEGN